MSKKDKPQSEKFKEMARELGADKSGVEFERAIQTIMTAKKKRKDNSSIKDEETN